MRASKRSVRSSTGLVVVMAGARLSTWFEDQGNLLPSARACRLQRREPAAGHERGQEARRQKLDQLQPARYGAAEQRDEGRSEERCGGNEGARTRRLWGGGN